MNKRPLLQQVANTYVDKAATRPIIIEAFAGRFMLDARWFNVYVLCLSRGGVGSDYKYDNTLDFPVTVSYSKQRGWPMQDLFLLKFHPVKRGNRFHFISPINKSNQKCNCIHLVSEGAQQVFHPCRLLFEQTL
jgi:hypothetical protein